MFPGIGDLSSGFRLDFVRGFSSAAPVWYTVEDDRAASACPWCEPWMWADPTDWWDGELTAYEMGARWASMTYERMEIVRDDAEAEAMRRQQDEAEEMADILMA